MALLHQHHLRYRPAVRRFAHGTGCRRHVAYGSGFHGRLHRPHERRRPHCLGDPISDYIGRSATYVLFFVIEILAFWQLAGVTGAFSFQVLVLLIISCYGGGFSCMPAYLSDLFGTKYLSAIHGRILTAWGAAGVAGPLVLSLIKENTNSYAVTLYFFVGAFTVALALMLFLKYRTRHGIARVAEARG